MRKSQSITDKIIAGLFIPIIVMAVIGVFGPMINGNGERFIDWQFFFDEFPKSIGFDTKIEVAMDLGGFTSVGLLVGAVISILILLIYGLINTISTLTGKSDLRAFRLTGLLASASACYLGIHMVWGMKYPGAETQLGWGAILIIVATGIALFLSHLRKIIVFSAISGKYATPSVISLIASGLLFGGMILVSHVQFKSSDYEFSATYYAYQQTATLIKAGTEPSSDDIITTILLLVSGGLFNSALQLSAKFIATDKKKEKNYRKSSTKLVKVIFLAILTGGAIATLLSLKNFSFYSSIELEVSVIVFAVFVAIALVLAIVEASINKACNLSYDLHEKGKARPARQKRVRYDDDEVIAQPIKQAKRPLDEPIVDDDEVTPVVEEEDEEVPIVVE